MTSIAPERTTSPSYDSVTLRQRTSQPFLIPPKPEDVPASLPLIRLHISIEDAELRAAVHAIFDGKDQFEVVTGPVSFSAGARVRVSHLSDNDCGALPIDGTPIVLIGSDMEDETVLAAVRAGAWALVCERSSGEELTAAVREAANGECPILRHISGRRGAAAALIEQVALPSPEPIEERESEPSPLTDNETEILRRVADGHNTRRIAADLGFQEQTIKNRITGIFNKLGPRSRAGAVAEAQRQGWL